VEHGEPDVALEDPAVCGLEAIDPHRCHPDLREAILGDPAVLAAGIHHHLLDVDAPLRLGQRGDADGGSEDSHVVDHRALSSLGITDLLRLAARVHSHQSDQWRRGDMGSRGDLAPAPS
jgi:hypothetical protein